MPQAWGQHNRKADHWERTSEFPLSGTKSYLFKFEIQKGKNKGKIGKAKIRNENDDRSMARLQWKPRSRPRQLWAWAVTCWVGGVAQGWLLRSQLISAGSTTCVQWIRGRPQRDCTRQLHSLSLQQLMHSHFSGSHNKTSLQTLIRAPKPAPFSPGGSARSRLPHALMATTIPPYQGEG